jgi:uncharacterized protein
MIDLDATTRHEVELVLRRFLPETEVRLVGSRARSGAKRQADIDLLVMRPEPLSPRQRAMLNTAFEESHIPFKVDVLEWESLTPSFRQRLMEGGAPVLCERAKKC